MVYKTEILLILSANLKTKTKMKKLFLALFVILLNANFAYNQCDSWVDKPIEEDAKNAHSIYRQALKIDDYKLASEYWEQVFKIAPVADGNRDYHFWDGMKILTWKMGNETDQTKKAEYVNRILGLYNQLANCYEENAINVKNCNGDSCGIKQAGFVLGRKAYEMYYTHGSSYKDIYETLKQSIDKANYKAEYIVLDPFGVTLADLYSKGEVSADEARHYIEKVQNIAEYNIKNDKTYGAYFKQGLEKMDYDLADVEKDVFDCEFFKKKFMPLFKENKDNGDVVKYILVTLKRQECPQDDEFLVEVENAWKVFAEEYNAALRDSLEKVNPALAASRLANEGNYSEAAKKYEEGIDQETDPEKKANYLYALASIQFGELNQLSSARANALKAAQLKPNWGKPYILIGDMYSKSAKSCGDDWNQRLAILAALEKYYYAKSIDPNSVGQANNRIGKFEGSKPRKDEGFMRGMKEGQIVNTGCWINENVKLRFSE